MLKLREQISAAGKPHLIWYDIQIKLFCSDLWDSLIKGAQELENSMEQKPHQ